MLIITCCLPVGVTHFAAESLIVSGEKIRQSANSKSTVSMS